MDEVLFVGDLDAPLLWFLLLPLVFLLAALGIFFLMLRGLGFRPGAPTEADEEEGAWERLPRPWWGNPVLWLVVAAALVLLGVFVAPRFLPGVIVLIPFFWIGGRRRRRRSPRSQSPGLWKN